MKIAILEEQEATKGDGDFAHMPMYYHSDVLQIVTCIIRTILAELLNWTKNWYAQSHANGSYTIAIEE